MMNGVKLQGKTLSTSGLKISIVFAWMLIREKVLNGITQGKSLKRPMSIQPFSKLGISGEIGETPLTIDVVD